MKLIHKFQSVLRLEGIPLILQLYLQILNRIPAFAEVRIHLHSAYNDNKIRLFYSFLESAECRKLTVSGEIAAHPLGEDGSGGTALEVIRDMLQMDGEAFIVRLYQEILNRYPATHELARHLPALQSGVRGKWELLMMFIRSQEAGTLLMQPYSGDTQAKDLMQTLDTLMHIWSAGRR
ncbi:DUF4214 domain-containing protein [Paenibacillus thalictri]|uniref:DUF4214 domain-containing protein n=1 Tax=Paenibacillus thalictri TaxID=2527873 RepID=UPI0013EF00D0|nr:DUF4214 domain-containing protein [Paenibacillus thalictri]